MAEKQKAEVGAVVLDAVNDFYAGPCRITGILWVGSTTTADAVSVKGRLASQNRELWGAQTDTSNTYLGFSWGLNGLHCPHGFRADALPAGRILVYISE